MPRPWTLGLLLLALLLGATTLRVPYMNDDYMQLLILEHDAGLREAADPLFAAHQDPLGLLNLFYFVGDEVSVPDSVRRGALPWFTWPELDLAFWRPLTSTLAQLEFRVFGANALVSHVHSILWYLALVLLVSRLLWRVAPGLAPLAALLWTIDEAHALPVSWAANRNALISASFGLAALNLHISARERSLGAAWPLSALCWALALSAGEAALGSFGYLAAYELFGRREPLPRRLLALSPALGVGLAWALFYRAAGFGARGSMLYTDPGAEPLVYLSEAPMRFLRLWGAELTGFTTDIGLLSNALLVPQALWGLGALALFAWGLRQVWPQLDAEEQGALRWLLPGAFFSILPVLATFALDRLLLLPSVGAVLLIAALMRHGLRRALGWGGRVAGGLLALVHLVLPAPMWLVMSLAMLSLHSSLEALADSGLRQGEWKDRDLIMLRASDMGAAVYFPMIAEFHRYPNPNTWIVGNPSPVDASLSRPDPNTLTMTLLEDRFYDGFVTRLMGHPAHPPQVGDCMPVSTVQVCVEALGEQGPTRWSYRGEQDLEQLPLDLLLWDGTQLTLMEMPTVGSTVALPYRPGPSGM